MSRTIWFPPYVLDTTAGLLWRGRRLMPLRRRAFDVLSYLAERPGCVVSSQELRARVWADVHVSDIVVKVCIREVRMALRDSATSPRYVATLPKRGYCFVAPVEGSVRAPSLTTFGGGGTRGRRKSSP